VFKGAIPPGIHVLHECDIGACINPAHLFLGTNTDNIEDSMNKGRRKGVTRKRPCGLRYNTRRGAHDAKLKIPRNRWPEVKNRLDAGETQASLAAFFGVDPSTISNIKRRLLCGA
jgi:hypothetical protein